MIDDQQANLDSTSGKASAASAAIDMAPDRIADRADTPRDPNKSQTRLGEQSQKGAE